MDIVFDGEVVQWRGPAPYYFVAMPEDESRDLKAISNSVTYGWGVIPVQVQIGGTTWKTSLFPKGDRYLVPIKAVVRKAEQLEEGDMTNIRLVIEVRQNTRTTPDDYEPD